jgi:fatty acid desaturase
MTTRAGVVHADDTDMDAEQLAPRAKGEYAELKREVKARGLLKRQSRYYAGKAALTAVCLGIACVGLAVSGGYTWLYVLDAAFLAFVFVQVGLLAHDLAHQQIVGPGRVNAVAGVILGNLLLGVSRAWWRDNHDAHHAHPNDLDGDPNLQIYLIGCTPEQALGRPAWVQWVVRHQVGLLVPIFCLELLSMHYQSLEYVLQRKPGLVRGEGVLLMAHFVVYAVAVYAALGLWGALLFALVNQCLTGLYLAGIFAPNHKGMPFLGAIESPAGFLRQQVLTARNVRGGYLVDLIYGGLNYQVEHHLFPTMPRNNLRRAQPIVRGFCQARGIAYCETGAVQAWREIVGHFAAVSRSMVTARRSAGDAHRGGTASGQTWSALYGPESEAYTIVQAVKEDRSAENRR